MVYLIPNTRFCDRKFAVKWTGASLFPKPIWFLLGSKFLVAIYLTSRSTENQARRPGVLGIRSFVRRFQIISDLSRSWVLSHLVLERPGKDHEIMFRTQKMCEPCRFLSAKMHPWKYTSRTTTYLCHHSSFWNITCEFKPGFSFSFHKLYSKCEFNEEAAQVL